MAAREKATEKHLAAIRELHHGLASQLEKHSPETVELTYDMLQRIRYPHPHGRIASMAFATELREGLDYKAFDANLHSIMFLLQKQARRGYDAFDLVQKFRKGVQLNLFTVENMPQILSLLHKEHGQQVSYLTNLLYRGLTGKGFTPQVLEIVARNAEKGKDPAALITALQTQHLPPTPENLKALNEAEPHILRAYDFLHGVETEEDHKSVSAPLFAQVLHAWKKNPSLLEKEAFWKSVKIHAQQLKALKTRIKPA